MISFETLHTDLNALSDTDLEKLQLAVNGEVAVRIQAARLASRIEKAVMDAQAVGFNDAEIATVFEETTSKARSNNTDPDFDPTIPVEPAQRGPSAPRGRAASTK